jgi:hypothetical protein
MSMNGKVKWNYEADWLASCNCDWGCPCNFNQTPTQGFCTGVYAGHIKNGKCGETALDGVSFVWATKWPGAIHEGGGTTKIWIDEKASRDQKKTLDQILKGELGGKPWGIFSNTVDNWLETAFVPVELKMDGSKSSYKAGMEAHAILTPMINPITGEEAQAKIVLPNGLVCEELNATATRSFAVFTKGLKFAAPGKYGFYTKVSHGN